MTARHYLDHNATAPVMPQALDAATAALKLGGNASGVHAEGRAARALVEGARSALRALVGAPDNGVIFVSSGTEAVHLALHGSVAGEAGVARIFVSALEHAAVLANAETTGAPVEIMPAQPDGRVDLGWLRARLDDYDEAREGRFLVCLMLANNETGVIQPIEEAAALTHEKGGLVFVDAAQGVGRIPVDFAALGADMLALTGHKFGAPQGAGALVVAPGLPLSPVMRGGGQEENRRAGTLNVPAIAGLGAACAAAGETIARGAEIAALRDRIEAAVTAAGARVWGEGVPRLPGTLYFSAPGFPAETQLMTMDLARVAVSAGAACSSGKAKASHVLKAMGATEDLARSAIRVSLGWSSVDEDADAFIAEWTTAYDRVKAKAA